MKSFIQEAVELAAIFLATLVISGHSCAQKVASCGKPPPQTASAQVQQAGAD